MAAHHDRRSGDPARSSVERSGPPWIGGRDPLSDVLRNVKLGGALFFVVEATAPWCTDVPETGAFQGDPVPARPARDLVSHRSRRQRFRLGGRTGAVGVRRRRHHRHPEHGDPYRIESEPGAAPELDRDGTLQFFRDMMSGRRRSWLPRAAAARRPRSSSAAFSAGTPHLSIRCWPRCRSFCWSGAVRAKPTC